MWHKKFGWESYNTKNEIPKTEKEFVLRLLDEIQEDVIRYRLSNLVIWYIDKAKSRKYIYYTLNIIAIIANLLILIANSINEFIPYIQIITTCCAAVSSGTLAVCNFGRYKDNWMRYRATAETLKGEISQYVIKRAECRNRYKMDLDSCSQCHTQKIYGNYNCPLTAELLNRVNEHVAKEILEWRQTNSNEDDTNSKGQ